MFSRLLIVFSRVPRWGEVKRRLAQGVGEERALRVHLHLLGRTLEAAAAVRAERWLLLHPPGWDRSELPFPGRLLDSFRLGTQDGPDLGARMRGALLAGLGEGFERVVLTGSDTPGIGPGILEEAFTVLDEAELVLGPSMDGGYYLIGVRKGRWALSPLFEGIPWGTGEVLKLTLSKAGAAGLCTKILPELRDIDRPEDLASFAASNRLVQ